MTKLNDNGDIINENADILTEIADKTRQRIAEKMQSVPMAVIKRKAEAMNADTDFPFEKAIRRGDFAFICEVKKASPSKGVISMAFPHIQIAKDYEKAGAAAISCLTEPYYFQGENRYLKEITVNVNLPVLRKDFTIHPYMIYEAKVLGASAILLICSILDDEHLKYFHDLAISLGMSVVVEAHDAQEVERALNIGAKIIGVNNRNLKTFELDINNSIELKKLVPDDVIFISESGIKTKEDIKLLHENGIKAVLMGETFMKAENKVKTLAELKSLVF